MFSNLLYTTTGCWAHPITILTRRRFSVYKMNEISLYQLSDDVLFIYNDLTRWGQFSSLFSPKELGFIQEKILKGEYILSHLQIKIIDFKTQNNDIIRETILSIIKDHPECGYVVPPLEDDDSRIMYILHPSSVGDTVVLMALSMMLLRYINVWLPKESYSFMDTMLPRYIQNRKLMGKERVDRVYMIQLTCSLREIPMDHILDILHDFVGDYEVYKLIKSFISLPILDDMGLNCKDSLYKQVLPNVGDIYQVLLEVIIASIFDTTFSQDRFPYVKYERFLAEIFIPIKEEGGNENSIIDEIVLFKFLEEIGMPGTVRCIKPGDDPILLPCCNLNNNNNYILFIEPESKKMIVCKSEEYF